MVEWANDWSMFRAPGGKALVPREVDGLAWLETMDGERFPIVDGIPRFVASEDYGESFGFQWNAFNVRQPLEDEKTFEAKTGLAPSALEGLSVLDAGCGGGRYARLVAEHGPRLVVGLDRSRAVEKARALCLDFPAARFAQAELAEPPFPPESFDFVFSIGVLHHCPDPKAAFDAIARLVRPGGRMSVWLYRKNQWWQEWINQALRQRTTRWSREKLLRWSRLGAWIGGVPLLGPALTKVVNFSHHPIWENRVCDTFDWYAPPWQSHHEPGEVIQWFEESGFREVRLLPPEKQGRFYIAVYEASLIMGSGVNVTGVKRT